MKTTFRIFVTLALLLSLCLTTVAVDFTLSVEAKSAPEVVKVQYQGEPVAAELIDINTGDVVGGVPLYDPDYQSDDTILELFVISFAEIKNAVIKNAVLEDMYAALLSAAEQVEAAPLITDLHESLEEQILRQIDLYYLGDAYYGNHYGNDKIKIEDLVVSDVFGVSLVRDKAEVVHTVEGKKIRFRLKTNFKKGTFFVLLQNTEGNDWRVEEDLEWYDDYTITVTTDRLSAFAFVVEKSVDLTVDPDGPRSPQTGSIEASPRYMYFGISAVCILAAGYFFVKAAKKAKAE